MGDRPKQLQPGAKIYVPAMSVFFAAAVVSTGMGIWWLAAICWTGGVLASMMT